MKSLETKLKGVLLIVPDVFGDNRGFFLESYSRKKYQEIGIECEFVQDNHSASTKGTLRGMHWQINPGQAKLVRTTSGEVFDVVVDIRKNSPTFGQWEGFYLSAENKKQLFVPFGFAHSFCVLSDIAEFQYKCSTYYSKNDERGFIWNDPTINIQWPIESPILSQRDMKQPFFKDLNTKDLF
ncbi:MAG TPA: dTDP-4-dehydrorhamnose 3,5-epimerase [Lentisphaeria bacterium]|nr:MAG: dTDP-4-dehydrorhamnose 3,5-epimerase [Lentisphaerae bacterium GWF2_38_69]HBM14875.1 dTDP-4-dehydrorhamnose 3,5-epimerase [Lentisphaeria bacterium]